MTDSIASVIQRFPCLQNKLEQLEHLRSEIPSPPILVSHQIPSQNYKFFKKLPKIQNFKFRKKL